MNHWTYIALAYGAFALLMIWDFLAPQWALKQTIRSIILKQRKSGKS